MRKPMITIQLHGCVFNRKIVRRIAFQYWIAFMVALEEGCKITDLVLLKDFFSMLIMNLKMRSATNTDRAPIEKNHMIAQISFQLSEYYFI